MIRVLLKQKSNKGFEWYHCGNSYAIGYACINGIYGEGADISRYLDEAKNTDDFIKKASGLNGIFSAIYVNGNEAAAFTDKYGVRKIFYCQVGGTLYIGDDVKSISCESGNTRVNPDTKKDWVYAGFSVYDETLIQNILSLNASQYLVLHSDNRIVVLRYNHFYIRPSDDNYEKIRERLNLIFMDLSGRLVKSLDGQKAVVPLSGGIDSRFCLLLLKEAGYENVLCITYGRVNGKEEIIARRAAEAYGYEYMVIPYKRSDWSGLFKNEENLKYIDYASDFKAVPHFSDLFAARFLAGLPGSSDFIIIPGHIGSIADSIMIPGSSYTKDDFLNLLIRKYFYFYGYKLSKHTDYLKKRLDGYYKEESPLDSIRAQSLFDSCAYDTYRSNHLMMALRSYDYYGFKWRIPLMDDELTAFFETVPLQYKTKNKFLLSDFVSGRIENDPGYYIAAQSYIGKVIKNILDRRYSCIKPLHVFKLKKDEYELPALPAVIYRYYRNFLSYVSARTLRYLLNRINNENT